LLATPRRATPFFNILPLAANRLMARQLTRKAENLLKHRKCETITVAKQARREVFTGWWRYLPEECGSGNGSFLKDSPG
jgi:hypothetical protein